MGPPRKRKEPPQNCTLLDFFSNPDALKRARTSQQLAPAVRQAKVVRSREIIVIDSDSDGDGRTRVPELPRPLNSTASALTWLEDTDTFGPPSALLRSPNPRVEASSGLYTRQRSPVSPGQDQGESMFGVSAPLLEERTYSNQFTEGTRTNPATHDHESTTVRVGSPEILAVDFSIGEWAAGDDELVALDDNAGTDEGEQESLNEQCRCPVCGIDLTGTEAQIHVNQCLDTTSWQDNIATRECLSTLPSTESGLTPDECQLDMTAKSRGSDLFTVLMNSNKDKEVWVEADAVTNYDFRPSGGNRRKAPFYKVLQGMPIAVDAFCYGAIPGITAYFLSHAHSDHYTSLGSKWKSGSIYCSEETANLIIHMLAVDPRWIHPLPLDTPTIVPDTGGVSVTLIEANHCPGSCLFFFEGPQTIDAGDSVFKSPFIGSSRIFRYMHCGDFRASPRHVLHPAVNGKHIDLVYLDTTYLNPKYTFPPQPLVISACAELARRQVMGGVGDDNNACANRNPTIDTWIKPSTLAEAQTKLERTLVIVGTYSIGKERIVKAIAQALGTKIYCDPRKAAILRCQADKELHALLTADPAEAGVHLLPLGTVTSDNLKSYLQRFKGTFSRIMGFRPTGWTYSPPSSSDLSNESIRSIVARGQSRDFSYKDLQPSPKSSYNIQTFGVPYSEHSSFFELTCFAMSCDWGRMIPTVNVGSPTARAKMNTWLKRWVSEKRSTKSSVMPPRAVDYW